MLLELGCTLTLDAVSSSFVAVFGRRMEETKRSRSTGHQDELDGWFFLRFCDFSPMSDVAMSMIDQRESRALELHQNWFLDWKFAKTFCSQFEPDFHGDDFSIQSGSLASNRICSRLKFFRVIEKFSHCRFTQRETKRLFESSQNFVSTSVKSFRFPFLILHSKSAWNFRLILIDVQSEVLSLDYWPFGRFNGTLRWLQQRQSH